MTVPTTWPRDIAAAGGAYWRLTQFNDEPLAYDFMIKDMDYTGAEFSGRIRAAFEESSAVLASFAFQQTLIGDDTIVVVSLSDSAVKSLRSGIDPGAIETLFYSIKVTPPGGDKRTWFAGEFLVQGA